MSEFDLYNDYDASSDVSATPENKDRSKSNDHKFTPMVDNTYRISIVYFQPIAQTIAQAMIKAAKKAGTEVDKDQFDQKLKATLTKIAESKGKSYDALEDWEKLDLSTVQFKKYTHQYAKGVGDVLSRRGKDGPAADEIWASLGDESTHYGTAVVVYPCNQQGELLVPQENLIQHLTVKVLRVTVNQFNQLVDLNTEMSDISEGKQSLASQDLRLVKEKVNGFDKTTFKASSPALWRKTPQLREVVLKKMLAISDKIIASREMTTKELKIKLGMDTDVGSESSDGIYDMDADAINNSLADLDI